MTGIITLDHMTAKRESFINTVEVLTGKTNPIVSNSDLIFRANLKDGQRVYEINMNERNGVVFPEQRLLHNHWALPVAASIYIAQVVPDTVNNPTLEGANYDWYTYPDQNVFTDTDGTVINYQSLKCIYYGGTLSIKIGGNYAVREINTHHFLNSPNRPFQSPTASGETNPVLPEFNGGLPGRGYHRIDTDVILKGGEENRLVLSLGEGNANNLVGGNVNANLKTEVFIAVHCIKWDGEAQQSEKMCSLIRA